MTRVLLLGPALGWAALAFTPAAAQQRAAPVAHEPPPAGPVLTVQQAISLATGRQPSVVAYDADAVASEQAAIAARSLPDPQLTAGVESFPVTGKNKFSPTRDEFTMYTIGVMREQVRRSRREAEAARLRAEAAVSRFEGSAQQKRIQRDVMKAWLDAVEARAKQRLLERVIGDLKVGRQVMEAGIPTGSSTPALELAAQAEISLAESELDAAHGAEARARGMLRRWIGPAADRPLPDYIPRLDLPPGVLPDFSTHPEVLVANAQEQAARRQVDVARRERRPNVTWSVNYAWRPDFGDFVSGSLSIPLQINRRNLQDRKIAEAQARVDAARLRAEDTRRDLGGQYQQALADYRSADARIAEIRDDAIPSLEGSFKAAQARYASGQGTLELPLNVVRRYVEANIQLVEQEGAKARAAADLLYLSGDLKP